MDGGGGWQTELDAQLAALLGEKTAEDMEKPPKKKEKKKAAVINVPL